MPEHRTVDSPVRALLGAVRLRLWRLQFVAGVRLASWGSAGLMLLAVAVHLAVRPIPVGVVLIALAVLWALPLAWAVWRRPTDPACALWADRHLGGASAFTTVLELGPGAKEQANAPAVAWLESWAAARVPDARRRLAAHREPARLSRSVSSLLVCAALAATVLAMPELSPSTPQPVAASAPSAVAARPALMAGAPESAARVGEIAGALRSTQSPDAPGRREAGGAPAAGSTPATGASEADGAKGPFAAQTGASPAGDRPAPAQAPAGTLVDTAAESGRSQAAATGSGREAGDSRDNRTEVGASRAAPGTTAVQRSRSRARRPSAERQADVNELAAYDEEPTMPGTAPGQAEPDPAAATPPPATPSMRLTTTEAGYVQAWMKASGQRR